MNFQQLTYEKDGPILRIAFNRPEKRNALSDQLHAEYKAALDAADADDEIRVIVLSGNGESFCSGNDLALGGKMVAPDLRQDALKYEKVQAQRMAAWFCKKPVIAQIHGYCLAAGLDVILSCDITVAEEGAIFGNPPMRLLGGASIATFWPLLIGPQWAKRLLMTGDSLTAVAAERIGLITHCVPHDQLASTVNEIARRISLVPGTIAWTQKSSINRVYEIMGLRAMQQNFVDHNAVGHQSKEAVQWFKRVDEIGLTAALRERDEKFGDYIPGKGRVPTILK